MGTLELPELPEHLAPLLTDEPVLDVYSHGPWRVPDGLYQQITEQALALNGDPRTAELTCDLPGFYGGDTTATGADLWCLLEFLLGASALPAGPRRDVQGETMGAVLAAPGDQDVRTLLSDDVRAAVGPGDHTADLPLGQYL